MRDIISYDGCERYLTEGKLYCNELIDVEPAFDDAMMT